ncbi:hypothetical protein V5O48_010419 [Marasmius crinis-equi]|uniref:Uncharacterized protein n=1 Tax=Marasmius crinis-equi TaxID=585013 RepID=A0ABR3F912_9AGAR
MSGLSNTQEFNRVTAADRTNQGIRDGLPEGQNPPRAPVQLDTVVDKDASAPSSTTGIPASSTLNGATSQDVHNHTLGKPGSGQTSNELHHDGNVGGKRDRQGVHPGQANVELDRAQRETGRDREAFRNDQ